MDDIKLQKIWSEKYKIVPEQLKKTSAIRLVATGFNTNIDAVAKISGQELSVLAEHFRLNLNEVENYPAVLNSPKAVICGIVKCFVNGIAEEWLTTDQTIDEWIEENIATNKTQMGGQAGIIANVLALTNAQKILVNTASHPASLSKQFIKNENLFGADENAELRPAYQINRPGDMPPVHRIIEFAKGDELVLNGKKYVCPKANRFIATYDPLNAEMKINEAFAKHLSETDFDYFIFAGYNLLSGEKGLIAAEKSADFLQKIKSRGGILHLEIASTQDKKIRRYMLEKITGLCDSIGLNERETLDAVEVLFPSLYEELKDKRLNIANLLDAVVKIKEFTKVKRLQLHIFGLYLCLQDNDYKYTPQQSLNGMLCAAIAAASKAELGWLKEPQDLLYTAKTNESHIYFAELLSLAEHLQLPQLLTTGIAEYKGYNMAVVPTMLIENPKTLVGMGDTISSLSLICAR